MQQAKFIVFEGINGSGKTTQSKILTCELENKGYETILVTEPGTTPIGEEIRKIVKSTDYGESSPITQLMLYNAARSELVRNIIIPALLNNKIVISDRYVASSIAYQGFAQGLHPDLVKTVCDIATNELKPDLTILLDLPVEKALERTVSRHIKDPKLSLDIEFHKKVQNGFYISWDTDWVYIDAGYSINDVSKQIENTVNKLLNTE